ncbi:MAG: glutamate racemase [Clostridia bacterium]|nr:glutamate racemase [Clostridia bacterium]
MADNRPIGVFDSGLGGLTVMKELIKLLPNEDIVYFGDTGRVPYGTRSSATIEKYALQDQKLLLKHDVKLIVAACGTVSSVAKNAARQSTVPYFGVVEHAARQAAKVTKNQKIGVIGTAATIKSGAHEDHIKEILPNATVIAQCCSLFVPLVEEGWVSKDNLAVYDTAKRYLEPIKQAGVDTLILGCTHYPLLKDVIASIMGEDVTLINMGEATALAVAEYIKSNSLSTAKQTADYRFMVTDKTASFTKTASMLMGQNVESENIELVDIDKL